MYKTRMDYESPEAMIVPLAPRRVVCQSGTFGINGFEEDPDELSM